MNPVSSVQSKIVLTKKHNAEKTQLDKTLFYNSNIDFVTFDSGL